MSIGSRIPPMTDRPLGRGRHAAASTRSGTLRALGRAASAAAAITMAAGACGPDGPAAGVGDVTTRDSAGITIVESSAPLLDDSAGWRLADEPSLQIGSLDDPEQSLGRVNAARTFADGRVVVFDVSIPQVRVFAADGTFVRAIGRGGDGPGEFRSGGNLEVLPGDTLLVYDLLPQRVSLVTGEGALVTTFKPQPDPNSPISFFMARLANGGYLTSGNAFGGSNGRTREVGWISRRDPDGAYAGKVIEYQAGEGIVVDGASSMPAPFARRHFHVFGTGRLVLGFADHFQFEMHGVDGTLERIVRRAGQPAPVTDAERDSVTASWRERYAEHPSEFRDMVEHLEFPPTHPAYDDLRLDLAGNVWMLNHRAARNDPARWSLFDREGRWTSDVTMPGDLNVMELGDTHVLALWRDELDIQYIRRYDLLKTGRSQ